MQISYVLFFLLTEKPAHKIRTVEGRIPTTVVATRKLGIQHRSTCRLQCLIGFTGTGYGNHIISVAMEDTECHVLSGRQACRIYRTTDRNSSRKHVRKAGNHIVSSHCSHRQSDNINSRFINLRVCQIHIEHFFYSPKCRWHLLTDRHLSRNKRKRTSGICPIAIFGTLRKQNEGRIFFPVDRIQKHLCTMRQLFFIVIASFTCSMQKQYQRILFSGLHCFRLQQTVIQAIARRRNKNLAFIVILCQYRS